MFPSRVGRDQNWGKREWTVDLHPSGEHKQTPKETSCYSVTAGCVNKWTSSPHQLKRWRCQCCLDSLCPLPSNEHCYCRFEIYPEYFKKSSHIANVCQWWLLSGSFSMSFFLKVADEAVCGPQFTEHWCNWVTCQWKFGKHMWEICFIKKQRESLNSFCLGLVPLANRYPDNKICLLCKPALETGVFFPASKDWAPQIYDSPCCYYWISYVSYASTGQISAFLPSLYSWLLCTYCISFREFQVITVGFFFSVCSGLLPLWVWNLFWVCWDLLVIVGCINTLNDLEHELE